jgi:glucose-6-phosphate isomerase
MHKLTELNEWHTLTQHYQDIGQIPMRTWFQNDPHRFSQFTAEACGLFLDYSRHRITKQTLTHLHNLTQAVNLKSKIESLFTGECVNHTENRPALHTALRNQTAPPLYFKGCNISAMISDSLAKMSEFTIHLQTGQWKGATGKAMTHVVNIGIGGSSLGAQLGTQALKKYSVSPLQIDFITGVDPTELVTLLTKIPPETTLFLISSKSFSTLETLTNANTLRNWLKDQLGDIDLSPHFIATTANPEKALAYGIKETHIFPIWDWVGGRYSIWSAVGLPLMLLIGPAHFKAFLRGAHEMDEHFKTAPFNRNLPMLLALLSIWYIHFFNTHAEALIPYSQCLRYLVPYLQQASMESLGKTVSLNGEPLSYASGSVLLGEEGCEGQHSYHQLLHQGSQIIPVDFILPMNDNSSYKHHHELLLASCLSQAEALMKGKTPEEAYEHLIQTHLTKDAAQKLAPHYATPGNRPSNILLIKQLSPYHLGALIALYEHKIFVQSAIWNINAFDQFGVELGKQLLPGILNDIQSNKAPINQDGTATSALINMIKHHWNTL